VIDFDTDKKIIIIHQLVISYHVICQKEGSLYGNSSVISNLYRVWAKKTTCHEAKTAWVRLIPCHKESSNTVFLEPVDTTFQT